MKVAAILVALALGASAPAAADPGPKLDMIAFFTGKTHGENVIHIALHHPHQMIVDSVGGRNKEGEFVLLDTVNEEGKPQRKRTWVMRPTGPNHFTGLLSDAKGPVEVAVAGDSATISYVMKDGGLKILQQIQLQRDGTLSNHVIARKFGMKFAEASGTIHKLD